MQRRAIVIAVVLLVAANVALVIWRSYSPSPAASSAMDRKIARQRERTEWEGHSSVPLKASDLGDKLSRMRGDNCVPVPVGDASLPMSSLTDGQRTDLFLVLADLLQSLEANNPDALVSLMIARGMAFDPERVANMRDLLKQLPGFSPEQVSQLDPDKLYVAYWKAREFRPSMDAVVVESSCITLWACPQSESSRLRDKDDLTRWVTGTWRGIHSPALTFIPTWLRPTKLENDGSSEPRLVADVKLILDNKQFRDRGRTPYLVRLVYDRERSGWQPILLVMILLDEVEVGKFIF